MIGDSLVASGVHSQSSGLYLPHSSPAVPAVASPWAELLGVWDRVHLGSDKPPFPYHQLVFSWCTHLELRAASSALNTQ